MDVNLVKRKEYQNEDSYKNRKIIYGGFKGQMTWPYYLTGFENSLHPYLEIVNEYVTIFSEDLFDEFRSHRFCEHYFFLFDDGFAISFTFRSWGDFMAAVENKGGTYLSFYDIDVSPSNPE